MAQQKPLQLLLDVPATAGSRIRQPADGFVKCMVAVLAMAFLAGCASVSLTPQERDSIRSAAAGVLPLGTEVAVDTQSHFLSKPDLVISAHLLKGHSADENSPYVRGDYGTHEKLTRLVRLRSAKIVRAVIAEGTLPKVGGIVVNACHGVRQSYIGQPSSGTDVAMTIYTVRFVLEPEGKQISEFTEEQIMDRFQVMRNIIPSLSFQTTSF